LRSSISESLQETSFLPKVLDAQCRLLFL
jgi:hypothetical protein